MGVFDMSHSFRWGWRCVGLVLFLCIGLMNPLPAHRLKGADVALDALWVYRGPEAFARGIHLGTGVDAENNIALKVEGTAAPQTAGAAWIGEYRSAEEALAFPAVEFLPAWNVRFDAARDGFSVELRLRWTPTPEKPAAWSSWYHLGGDGVADPSSPTLLLKDADALVDDDYILAKRHADAFQWRLRIWRTPSGEMRPPSCPAPALHLFTLAVSDPSPASATELKAAAASGSDSASTSVPKKEIVWPMLHDFPWRTQLIGTRNQGAICCPTSVAMVLEFFGDDRVTSDVARRCYDRRLRSYGCWPRAAQVLSEGGLDAWVERFRRIEDVLPYLEQGIPIIMSIQALKGEMIDAPYESTRGHIVILRGFDTQGNPLVSDPGTRHPDRGYRPWTRKEWETVWLAKGGVGILAAHPQQGHPRAYARRTTLEGIAPSTP